MVSRRRHASRQCRTSIGWRSRRVSPSRVASRACAHRHDRMILTWVFLSMVGSRLERGTWHICGLARPFGPCSGRVRMSGAELGIIGLGDGAGGQRACSSNRPTCISCRSSCYRGRLWPTHGLTQSPKTTDRRCPSRLGKIHEVAAACGPRSPWDCRRAVYPWGRRNPPCSSRCSGVGPWQGDACAFAGACRALGVAARPAWRPRAPRGAGPSRQLQHLAGASHAPDGAALAGRHGGVTWRWGGGAMRAQLRGIGIGSACRRRIAEMTPGLQSAQHGLGGPSRLAPASSQHGRSSARPSPVSPGRRLSAPEPAPRRVGHSGAGSGCGGRAESAGWSAAMSADHGVGPEPAARSTAGRPRRPRSPEGAGSEVRGGRHFGLGSARAPADGLGPAARTCRAADAACVF